MHQSSPRAARPARIAPADLERAGMAAMTRALAVRRLAEQRAAHAPIQIVAAIFLRSGEAGEMTAATPVTLRPGPTEASHGQADR